MKFSYTLPEAGEKHSDLVVADVVDLNELIRLCKKIRNKNGYFWPPLEEQLFSRTGYNERQSFKYNEFCKKLRDRMGIVEEDSEEET